jgi:hypothetical protein
MPTVTFATHCHAPHLERLHKPGVLKKIVDSHKYPFDEVLVVHQRCRGLDYRVIDDVPHYILESEEYYPQIFDEYGIEWPDPVLDELTHGPGAAHFWENHCLNHLIELKECRTDYIVFSDCDCLIIDSPRRQSWVSYGIRVLEQNRQVFCVSPSDGGDERMTQTMSQQCFLVETARMRNGPLNLRWNGKFDAPGGPFQEYYGLLEGRIGRLLTTYGLWRFVLGARFRYWHYNPWEPTK